MRGFERCTSAALAALVVLGFTGGVSAADVERHLAQWVVEGLQEQRHAAGLVALERRAELDTIARQRAERVAGLPHDQRLTVDEPIEKRLRQAGVREFRRVSLHLDMLRGYSNPAAAFLRRWRSYAAAWSRALDPELEALGLGVHIADDGWIILVALLLQDLGLPENLQEVERRTVRVVNALRRDHGLTPLAERPVLAEIARAHSEEMARAGFFSHRAADGRGVSERVRAHGLSYRRVAENIQMSRGTKDPVQSAVDSWMSSRSHRETILTPSYTETGVGVAIDGEGRIFFTQVFFTPSEPPR